MVLSSSSVLIVLYTIGGQYKNAFVNKKSILTSNRAMKARSFVLWFFDGQCDQMARLF